MIRTTPQVQQPAADIGGEQMSDKDNSDAETDETLNERSKFKKEITKNDFMELEQKKKMILLRSEKNTFKIICDPELPKDQTFLDQPQTLKLIFDKINKVLKTFYT